MSTRDDLRARQQGDYARRAQAIIDAHPLFDVPKNEMVEVMGGLLAALSAPEQALAMIDRWCDDKDTTGYIDFILQLREVLAPVPATGETTAPPPDRLVALAETWLVSAENCRRTGQAVEARLLDACATELLQVLPPAESTAAPAGPFRDAPPSVSDPEGWAKATAAARRLEEL